MRQICKIWNTTFLRCRSTISTNTKATNSFYKVARAEETWLSSFGVFCTLTVLHVSPNLKSGHQFLFFLFLQLFETHETNMRICCLIQGTYTTPKLNSQVSSARATLKNKFVDFVLVEIAQKICISDFVNLMHFDTSYARIQVRS